MHSHSRVQRLIIGVLATTIIVFGLPAAAQSVGSVAAVDRIERGSLRISLMPSNTAKPSMHSIANLGPSPRLRSALEGLETTDYRTTMMLCEE